MGVMRILDETGDTQVAWAVDDPASIERAEHVFRREVCRRVPIARRHGARASEARVITEFDPTADEIVWTRPVVAG
jgi:hypothetical protein